MEPEVNKEINDLKHTIKELQSVLMHVIEQMDNGTPLHSNSPIIKICRAELGIINK